MYQPKNRSNSFDKLTPFNDHFAQVSIKVRGKVMNQKREDYLLVTLKLYRDCARVQRQRTALALTAIEIEAFTHG